MVKCPDCMKEHEEYKKKWKYGNSDVEAYACVCGTDFSNPDETTDWAINKKYKQTCDIFLKFVFEKCVKMAEEGRI